MYALAFLLNTLAGLFLFIFCYYGNMSFGNVFLIYGHFTGTQLECKTRPLCNIYFVMQHYIK